MTVGIVQFTEALRASAENRSPNPAVFEMTPEEAEIHSDFESRRYLMMFKVEDLVQAVLDTDLALRLETGEKAHQAAAEPFARLQALVEELVELSP